jgi:outer membrane lipoprotein-sorting protein
MSNTEKTITEEELHSNPLLAMPVNNDSEIKQFLVNYTGTKLQPEDEQVTVHMIAETVAAEFPEFMFAIAEENFLRGYQLGLEDATTLDTETETVTGNEE